MSAVRGVLHAHKELGGRVCVGLLHDTKMPTTNRLTARLGMDRGPRRRSEPEDFRHLLVSKRSSLRSLMLLFIERSGSSSTSRSSSALVSAAASDGTACDTPRGARDG